MQSSFLRRVHVAIPFLSPLTLRRQCGRSSAPQIFGGSPGSGSGSSSSRSLNVLGGGRRTISRFFTRPFSLSFFANRGQRSEPISYSLPSIFSCSQSLVLPPRLQII